MRTHFDAFMDAFAAMDAHSRLLGGDEVLCPPRSDVDYQSTPRNALTFGWMGVDGVHYAILKLDGAVRDDSPVVQVSPMDSEDVTVLAGSFLEYLADGSQVSTDEMLGVIEAERSGKQALVPFLRDRFDVLRLLDEHRGDLLNSRFGHLVERKAG
jgi:hypothetical protein